MRLIAVSLPLRFQEDNGTGRAWLFKCFAVIAFALLASGIEAQSVSFLSRRDYPVKGMQVNAAGDFNGDGRIDLVVASDFGTSVTTLAGLGAGKLGSGIESPTGFATTSTSISAIKVGDLNGDGKLDLQIIGTDPGGGRYVSLLGNGDGTFRALPVSSILKSLFGSEQSLADFNGDGRLDAVIPSNKGTYFARGRGDGSFDAPVLLNSQNCGSSKAAELTGDLRLDVALACEDGVRVLPGNGDGTFGATILSPVSGSPLYLALGDFNRDNRLDVIVSESNDPEFRVLLGNGDGSFQPFATYPVLTGVGDFQLGDLNGDGALDVVAVVSASTRDVSVWFGAGDGSFQQQQTLVSGLSTRSTVLVSLRTEGTLDIVTASGACSCLCVHLNNGSGEFPDNVSVNLGITPSWMQKHDFDRDGHPDLLISDIQGLQILYGTGKAKTPFRIGWKQPLPKGSAYAVVADFNQDGKDDIASVSWDGAVILVFLGDDAGGFTLSSSLVMSDPARKLAVGDFNGDGKPDIATSWVQLLLGNGDGTFQPPRKIAPVVHPYFVMSVNLNGDKRSDLILNVQHTTDNGFAILLSAPDGGYLPPKVFIMPDAQYIQDGKYVDVNGDGVKDLVLTEINAFSPYVYLGSPGADFQLVYHPTSDQIPSAGSPSTILTGDFNGDGIPDMLAPGTDSYSLPIYLGKGDGTFTYDSSWGAGSGPLIGSAGRFTDRSRPGFDDLAILNGDGTLTLLVNLTPWAGNPAQE